MVLLRGLGLASAAGFLATGCTTPPSGESLTSALGMPLPFSKAHRKAQPCDYFKPVEAEIGTNRYLIRTTAYSHHEADSKPYGKMTAAGTTLRSRGKLRSAAADWSRYPVGTKFRIVGTNQIYEVDDYGSALVGTDTIDIYQPTLRAMRNWGAPTVGIEILEWGSMKRSLEIIESRTHVPHVKEMYDNLLAKCELVPDHLEDGFQVTDTSENKPRREV